MRIVGALQALLFLVTLSLLSTAMSFRVLASSLLRRHAGVRSFASSAVTKEPVGLIVTVEIKPDRVREFLKVMHEDAVDSVTKENGGCLKFDVLKHSEAENKFFFYEIYRDDAAVEFHKTTPHYQKWVDFKATGAVLSVSAVKVAVPVFETLKK